MWTFIIWNFNQLNLALLGSRQAITFVKIIFTATILLLWSSVSHILKTLVVKLRAGSTYIKRTTDEISLWYLTEKQRPVLDDLLESVKKKKNQCKNYMWSKYVFVGKDYESPTSKTKYIVLGQFTSFINCSIQSVRWVTSF